MGCWGVGCCGTGMLRYWYAGEWDAGVLGCWGTVVVKSWDAEVLGWSLLSPECAGMPQPPMQLLAVSARYVS